MLRLSRDERGTATILVLGLSVAVLMLGGLSVDFWRAIAARRALAAMADSSAAAGANAVDEEQLRAGRGLQLDPNVARAYATDALQFQSASRRIESVTIDADTQRVIVVVQQRIDFSLLVLFGADSGFTVRVSATAAPVRRP